MNDIVEEVKTTAKVEIKQKVYDAVIIN